MLFIGEMPFILNEDVLCNQGLDLLYLLSASENREEREAVWDTLTMHVLICERCSSTSKRLIH
jgi:hypothetical protein